MALKSFLGHTGRTRPVPPFRLSTGPAGDVQGTVRPPASWGVQCPGRAPASLGTESLGGSTPQPKRRESLLEAWEPHKRQDSGTNRMTGSQRIPQQGLQAGRSVEGKLVPWAAGPAERVTWEASQPQHSVLLGRGKGPRLELTRSGAGRRPGPSLHRGAVECWGRGA